MRTNTEPAFITDGGFPQLSGVDGEDRKSQIVIMRSLARRASPCRDAPPRRSSSSNILLVEAKESSTREGWRV